MNIKIYKENPLCGGGYTGSYKLSKNSNVTYMLTTHASLSGLIVEIVHRCARHNRINPVIVDKTGL